MGLKWGLWAAGGLSGLLRGCRTGWQRAAVAPDVASSPRASCRRHPCGVASSIPAAGGVERVGGLGSLLRFWHGLGIQNGCRTAEPLYFYHSLAWNFFKAAVATYP
jgi:hypothetical protein